MTFGLAEAAACMPCHADWLNDLSLMPPVSVTMQPVKLPVAAALVVAGADAELDAADALGALDALVALAAGGVALDVLLPHAAINTVAAPTATVTANLVGLTVSSRGKVSRHPA